MVFGIKQQNYKTKLKYLYAVKFLTEQKKYNFYLNISEINIKPIAEMLTLILYLKSNILFRE